jgi:RNA polymerase sigma factor (sigma-70 family)
VGRAAILNPPVTTAAEVPEADSEAMLVAAVRRGDDRAFEQLYARYQRRISAYVFGMVKDHGRAEDITQEVFISALRRMRETEREIAFKPWIYEIAKNACIDQFRRARRAEEVSFDAGEGLGNADQGRLVASEPTPDAAVDAKQQLDHLCGAFGGLSDSHHEILVLREFEGLSYREIGDRMGLSRPGVESTLFRARKRLTEEYDELVSGQRCVRIQSIIASAEDDATLGARDTRRLARHIAHCQPCRRQAVASGLDAAVLARKPVRRRIAERAASFLPLPAFLRSRGWHGGEQMVPVSEPMAAAWSKAVAAAATLIVAGVGAGVAPLPGSASPEVHHHAKPAAVVSNSSTSAIPSAIPTHVRAAGTRPVRAHSQGSLTHAGGRRHTTISDTTPKHSSPRIAGAPRSSSPVSDDPSHAAAPPNRAAVNPGASAPKPSRGVSAPSTGETGPAAHAPNLPSVTLPSLESPASTKQVGSAVTDTVGKAVTDTAGAVANTVDNVAGSLPKLGG